MALADEGASKSLPFPCPALPSVAHTSHSAVALTYVIHVCQPKQIAKMKGRFEGAEMAHHISRAAHACHCSAQCFGYLHHVRAISRSLRHRLPLSLILVRQPLVARA